MLISLRHNFAFFCTPKNASNSVEAMLKPYADIHLLGSPQVRHTNVRDYERYISPYLQSVAPDNAVERIALIREPVAWLYSWYRFRARSALRDGQSLNSTAHLSFAEFIDEYLTVSPRPFAQVGTQLEFVTAADGGLGIDRLYAYENLDELVAYFSALVGSELAIRAINVSPTKVYKSNLLEALGALSRRLRSRGGSGKSEAAADGRSLLSVEQVSAVESRLAEEVRMHSEARRGPLLKTEWDSRHSGAT